MCEEHRVTVMIELKAERKGEVVPCLFLLDRVLIVTNVFSDSLPAFTGLLGLSF